MPVLNQLSDDVSNYSTQLFHFKTVKVCVVEGVHYWRGGHSPTSLQAYTPNMTGFDSLRQTLASLIPEQIQSLLLFSPVQFQLNSAIQATCRHATYLAMRPITFLKQAFLTTCVAIALVGTIALVPLILPITFPLIFLALVVLLVLVLLALLITLLIVLVMLIQYLPGLIREDLASVTSASTQTQARASIETPKDRTTSISSPVFTPRAEGAGKNKPGPCHEQETDTLATSTQPTYPSFGIDSPRKNRQYYA